VYRKALDLIWLLIRYGADVNGRDDLGISVLLRAVLTADGSLKSSTCCSAMGLVAIGPSRPLRAAVARHLGSQPARIDGSVGVGCLNRRRAPTK